MKKLSSLLLLASLCAGMLFGCGSTDTKANSDSDSTKASADWSTIKSNGKLTIGITEYAPMNYYENGKLVGFDTEFAEAVCEKLGVKADFVVIEWDTKEIELSSKTIDCIWNGLTVTEDRKENMDFSKSYLSNKQVVVIRKSDAEKYTSLKSLSKATVVAESGSAGESAIAAALPDADYVGVSGQTDALLEVKAGTADAAVVDYTMAASMTAEGSDYSELTIANGLDMMDEEYAIGFRVGSDMTAKVNVIIDQMMKDGTLANLAANYDLTNLLIS